MHHEVRCAALARLQATLVFACLLSGGILTAHAQNTIYTVAGGGSVNGTATGLNADLPAPGGIAKDSAGNIYVAAPSSHDVFKIDGSGNLTVFAGLGYPTEHALSLNGKPATQASLDAPASVAVDKLGNVYIADTVNYMIRRVNSKGVIGTIAGNTTQCQDPTTACGDGAVGRNAQLNNPLAVATDAAGNVYIADTGDNRIRVVNVGTTSITIAGVNIAAGAIQTVAGNGTVCASSLAGSCGDSGAAISAQLNNPQGVALDSAGNIYISDSGDRRIRVVSTTGIINAYAGSGNPCFPSHGCGNGSPAIDASFSNPWQIAVDTQGNLFITDAPTNSVWEVDSATQTATVVAGFGLPGFAGDGGPAATATLNTTRGVAVDNSGNVLIADTGNQRIRQFKVGGNITTVAGGGNGNDSSTATSGVLGAARGLALDSSGNLYIADTFNNRIRQVTPSNPPNSVGTITTIAGTGIAGFAGDGGPGTSAQLNFPIAVALDNSNHLYIVDSGNFVIRKYDLGSGTLTTVAGTPRSPCNAYPCGDGGPALSATFARPTSIALDNGGNLYISDAGTHNVRVVNMGNATIVVAGVSVGAGNIQTVAGTGTPCGNPSLGQCGDNGLSTAAQLNGPFGVAVDGSGNIFIADTGDNRIREVLAATGTIVGYAYTGASNFGPTGNVPALKTSFGTPHYIALDPHRNLYISGSDNFVVIERVDAVSHNLVAVAGIPSNPKFYGFFGDGGLALLSNINNAGITIDGSGHLYVADDGNNRVREILLTPAASLSVTTLNFAPQNVKTTSPPLSFVLTNGGSDDLHISSISLSGPFGLRNSTCSNKMVSPKATCIFYITFKPVVVGPVSGSITINDDAFGSPSQTVTLNGTGQ